MRQIEPKTRALLGCFLLLSLARPALGHQILLSCPAPERVAAMVQRLGSEHPARRTRAAEQLMSWALYSAAPLARALTDPRSSPLLRLEAARVLRRLGAVAGSEAPRLALALRDELPQVRLLVVRTLDRCALQADPAVPALTVCLRDADPQVRIAAAEALGAIGAEARAAVPTLLARALADPALAPAARRAVAAIGRDLQRKERRGVWLAVPGLWWSELLSVSIAAAASYAWARQRYDRRWPRRVLPLLQVGALALWIADDPSTAVHLHHLQRPPWLVLGGTSVVLTLAAVTVAERLLPAKARPPAPAV